MDLVYDLGGFNGDDTAYYLLRGYRVICIEAVPAQADAIRNRFANEIASGQCIILNVAVGDREGTMPFYTCNFGALSSFDKARIENAGWITRELTVQVRTFDSILLEYGIPKFLKIDIEGADRHAILPLTRRNAPDFVSFEAGPDDLDLVLHLYSIGYRRFNLVRQADHAVVKVPPTGSIS